MKNNKLLCYDCSHKVDEHKESGCKRCPCKTSYAPKKKPIETYTEVDQLKSELDHIESRLNQL